MSDTTVQYLVILAFSVSEQYFHLRGALGIAIGEG